MSTVPRCDGIPIPNYQFHSYKNVISNADGLNQPNLNSLLQVIVKYYPQVITQEIIKQVVYISGIGTGFIDISLFLDYTSKILAPI